jgi:hypothetical protein
VDLMIERIFSIDALILLFSLSIVAMSIAAIAGVVWREDSRALLRAGEAALLAFTGGLLARSFISILLSLGKDSPQAGLAIGWGFFLWPGAIDTVAGIFGARLVTTPAALLLIATFVGAFTGMMDGIWKIHPWDGVGWLSFPLDVTWGLAGSTNASLIHLFNFAWAKHGEETRNAAHRYKKGFAFKPGFALTQGSVMSSLDTAPGYPLYFHERTHVWQNRGFGPFFTLTYLGWMALMLIPGAIAGLVTGQGLGQGIEKWSYFNNPWEVWPYEIQKAHGDNFRDTQGVLIWDPLVVIPVALFFFLGVCSLLLLIVNTVWHSAR